MKMWGWSDWRWQSVWQQMFCLLHSAYLTEHLGSLEDVLALRFCNSLMYFDFVSTLADDNFISYLPVQHSSQWCWLWWRDSLIQGTLVYTRPGHFTACVFLMQVLICSLVFSVVDHSEMVKLNVYPERVKFCSFSSHLLNGKWFTHVSVLQNNNGWN